MARGGWIPAVILLLVSCGQGPAAVGDETVTAANSSSHRADWMAQGSYGVMVHYLITPRGQDAAGKAADFNRTIDGFDLDHFTEQFQQSGADWLIFTIGQNTGYYNSPNPVLERLLPQRTPRRDLIAEIARRVKAMGKRFIVYLPVELAGQSAEVQQAFAWDPQDQTEFLRRYLEFVRAYSVKLGKLHDGWWFDGCYDNIHQGKWNWQDWLDAARAGNPDATVAFNDGAFCVGRVKPLTPLQDYHAGEVHLLWHGEIVNDFVSTPEDMTVTDDGRLLVRGKEARLYMPTSGFVDGVQWHALVPIDSTFNPGIPQDRCHYPDEELIGFLSACKKVGGAVTLNAPIDANGRIPEATAAQLKRLGDAIAKLGGHPVETPT
jgi:alpha-L-fucosidase